jgi:hypothetical protein
VLRIIASRWIHLAIWTFGVLFLAGYLALSGDWRVSVPWALAYVGIALAFSSIFYGVLRLHERLPTLDRYLLFDGGNDAPGEQISGDQWTLAYVKYHLDTGLRTKAVLLSPTEDGLVCVPVLLVGIGLIPAAIGGVVFGALHLARFTYLDCMVKAGIYGLVCYYILPHGLLTVVLGHFLTNGVAFAFMQMAERQLAAKLRSNSTVEPDARESGARGSP